jgi:hypothetical protein
MPCLNFDDSGTISGTVFNGSKGNAPVVGAEVILQVEQDGSFIPLAETTTDERGRFVFGSLPLDGDALFLVRANRDEVFHPGERVRLGHQHSEAEVNVTVFDALTDPSPLIARRHDIVIHAEPNLLNVTETILVSNPSSYCYVGGAEGQRPVTLRLQIPSNFEKVTFHKEFYGRRFAMIDGALMTTIPWPPGERELKFTYILPIEKQHQVWERPLDLPCSDVRLSVVGSDSKGITCNLQNVLDEASGELTFGSRGESLPPDHVVRVEFGHLPIPFQSYARWIALGVLTLLIAVATIALLRRPNVRVRPAKSEKTAGQRTPQTRSRPKQKVLPTGS